MPSSEGSGESAHIYAQTRQRPRCSQTQNMNVDEVWRLKFRPVAGRIPQHGRLKREFCAYAISAGPIDHIDGFI